MFVCLFEFVMVRQYMFEIFYQTNALINWYEHFSHFSSEHFALFEMHNREKKYFLQFHRSSLSSRSTNWNRFNSSHEEKLKKKDDDQIYGWLEQNDIEIKWIAKERNEQTKTQTHILYHMCNVHSIQSETREQLNNQRDCSVMHIQWSHTSSATAYCCYRHNYNAKPYAELK